MIFCKPNCTTDLVEYRMWDRKKGNQPHTSTEGNGERNNQKE